MLDRRARPLPRGRIARVLAPALVASLALSSGAMAQHLTMAVAASPTSLDPHFHNVGSNMSFSSAVFDNLLIMDANARITPGLAESWRMVSPTEWEFRLRPGVTFHNGSPLTAEDVAFTLERIPKVPNSPGPFTIYTRTVARAEVVDPLTVRLITAEPNPMLPNMIAQVPILSRTTHEGASTDDFNSGRALIGTGPFRFSGGSIHTALRIARNEAYWGPAPGFATVEQRAIPNAGARSAAILAGDVDFIDQVSVTDLPRLRQDARLRVVDAVSLRVFLIAFDHMRAEDSPFVTGPDGRPLGRNPLKDQRVRNALSLAIDRSALAERVAGGSALPSLQMMPPGTYGYVPDLPAPAADPARARALLAEAGYPNGFRITLHGPNDRYPGDSRMIQAIAQMWTRVGVTTAVEAQPWSAFITRASRQELSAHFVGWGSSTGEPATGLVATLGTWSRERGTGGVNRGRYSNPAFDTAIQAALAEPDEARREAAIQQVTRDLTADMPGLPLYIQKNNWAMRTGITYEGRADERSRPQDIRPAGP